MTPNNFPQYYASTLHRVIYNELDVDHDGERQWGVWVEYTTLPYRSITLLVPSLSPCACFSLSFFVLLSASLSHSSPVWLVLSNLPTNAHSFLSLLAATFALYFTILSFSFFYFFPIRKMERSSSARRWLFEEVPEEEINRELDELEQQIAASNGDSSARF